MKTKRILSLILAGTLALALTACGGGKPTETPAPAVNISAAEIWDTVSKDLELPMAMDMDAELLSAMYGINVDDLEDYVGKMPMMMVHATEFFIAKVKDGKMDDVKAACEKRQADLVEQWSTYLPEQLELVENYKLVQNGNYLMFAVTEHADEMATRFDGCTK